MSNKLSKETSPYLLQHANNPVDWYPWGIEALQKARSENKLILVSIGYSACHWCHVMEHESFEDKLVAQIMNDHFVCIKVDREERPDIDQIYMLAVQLMTGRGGWPLNCICLPDQRPIYGGTYFGKEDWKNVLLNLAAFWREKPEEAIAYAERLTSGIDEAEKLNLADEEIEHSVKDLEDIFNPWKPLFDYNDGGHTRAPKFPMPNNWQFLLRYAYFFKDDAAHVITKLTLQKMAYGGIYDHIGGGFARYSVDGAWHVPHFEKMLYDNAQMVSLYSEAYQYSKDKLYRDVVYQTINWLSREMTSENGGFYSALDADSEGVEGKFYTFTKPELQEILKHNTQLFCAYYTITDEGNWAEEHTNILTRNKDDEQLAAELGLSVEKLQEMIESCREKVFKYRDKRIHPGLDNKILASWNGLMLKGLTDAYRAFNEELFLQYAQKNAHFIVDNLFVPQGGLKRLYKPQLNDHEISGSAFLDDYAFVIDGFIGLYEATFDELWLHHAKKLTDYVLQNFYDAGTGMLYYTSQADEELISRKHEILDNVIPASNSAMAHNLYKLAHFFDLPDYLEQAQQMLRNVFPSIKTYGAGYSNWGMLLMNEIVGMNEIAITGSDFQEKRKQLEQHFIPNKIVLGGIKGTLPLLEGKFTSETNIYVCKDKTCQLPVANVDEALKQIR